MAITSNLVGIQLNCRSINTGLGELKMLIYSEKPDFVLLSETWLNNNTKFLPRFHNYRAEWKHRPTGQGGGLGILVRRGLQYRNLDLTEYSGGVLEFQAIRIYEKSDKFIDVLGIYNPNKNLTISEFRHYIAQLSSKYVIAGDFNAHSRLLDDQTRNHNQTGRVIENILMNDQICINTPANFFTYVNSSNYTRSCLDLCFSSPNLAPMITLKQLIEVRSDHLPIQINIQIKVAKCDLQVRKKWKETSKNLEIFSEHIKPTNLYKPNNIDNILEDFVDRLHSAAITTIGQTSGKPKATKRTTWWNSDCSRAIALKRKSWINFEKHPTTENSQLFQANLKNANNILKKTKKESFKNYVNSIKFDTPLNEAWIKLKSLKGYHNESSSPIIHNDIIITDTKEKANIFASHYHSLFINHTHKTIDNFINIKNEAINSYNDEEEYNRDITKDELDEILQKTKNTAAGGDQITYSFLKSLKQNNCEELLDIYNQSLNTKVFPCAWKKGIILPIKKPQKDSDNIKSYRPITLLSCIGKIFERIIQQRIEHHIEKKSLFNKSQCGFRKGMGTIDILLRLENVIRSSLDTNQICLVAYIDLKSAFDMVWGNGLLFKFIQMGFKGKIVGIIDQFFHNRIIKVSLNGVESDEKCVGAGTPQGSVLSPILFNVMLSDLPEIVGVEVHTYADDITITCTGSNLQETKKRLQDYLKKLEQWTDDWGLKVNPEKCVIQYYTKKKISYPILRIKNTVLKYEKHHKILGLIFDSPKLQFHEHIEYLKRDCNRRLDILKCISSPTWGASQKY